MAGVVRLLSECFSVLLGNVFSDGGNDVVGLPLVRGVPLDDLAVFADEHGGE